MSKSDCIKKDLRYEIEMVYKERSNDECEYDSGECKKYCMDWCVWIDIEWMSEGMLDDHDVHVCNVCSVEHDIGQKVHKGRIGAVADAFLA